VTPGLGEKRKMRTEKNVRGKKDREPKIKIKIKNKEKVRCYTSQIGEKIQ
jgi:hypothetical protein